MIMSHLLLFRKELSIQKTIVAYNMQSYLRHKIDVICNFNCF